jgi:pSer/pThr/pTyr-binding forkhead associated (FHA) protein
VGHLAHPIGEELCIGSAPQPGDHGILRIDNPGIASSHCRLRRLDNTVVVETLSDPPTLVNGQPIQGSVVIQTGDRLQLGDRAFELLVIDVVEPDGTP